MAVESFHGIARYFWERKGFTLQLTHDCPPNALCTPPPHYVGTRDGDQLTLYRNHVEPRHPWRSERVR